MILGMEKTVICPRCGRQCRRQGLGVHVQRAHNPDNNYRSRKGLRFRYDDAGGRRLKDVSDEPKREVLAIFRKGEYSQRPRNPTQWQIRALKSQERILARYGHV